eukprot:TRINITY_DN3407_c0_g1_i1.p1 TRINITY_DN3407_c0_g1~~TRINITY_DN3407_c0_g1_i1.p1  ORF type:complete len:240 (-),score=48.44 TRINITY_DN3407_c0_g1_i1:62-781(-)
MTLNMTIKAATLLDEVVPSSYSDVSQHMYIPFDSVNQRHPEFDGYKGQTIKQADVILLGFPWHYDMPTQVRVNDLLYYEPRTDANGPAMTYSMHAIAYLELNDLANSEKLFAKAYANVQPPFDVWTETPKGGAINFITGAGGFLQSCVFGYPGVRLLEDGLTVNPLLFPKTTFVRLRKIFYLDNFFDFSYDEKYMYFEAKSVSSSSSPLIISSAGSVCLLSKQGDLCTFARAFATIKTK